MGNRLYVGNLPYSMRDDTLEDVFTEFGTVTSAKVIMERGGEGRSKGFGFVDMASDAEAKAAIDGLNGQEVEGRSLVVNEARPMTPRAGGGGHRGGGRSDRGGGYGGGRGGYGDGGRRGGGRGGYGDGGGY